MKQTNRVYFYRLTEMYVTILFTIVSTYYAYVKINGKFASVLYFGCSCKRISSSTAGGWSRRESETAGKKREIKSAKLKQQLVGQG